MGNLFDLLHEKSVKWDEFLLQMFFNVSIASLFDMISQILKHQKFELMSY